MIAYDPHYDRLFRDNEHIYPKLECDKYIYSSDGSPNGDSSIWYVHDCQTFDYLCDSYCDDSGELILRPEWQNKRKAELKELYIPGYWSYPDIYTLSIVVFTSLEAITSWFEKIDYTRMPSVISDPKGQKYKLYCRKIVTAERIV